MKRFAILHILLFCLALGGLAGLGFAGAAMGGGLEFSSKTLYGAAEAAAGVSVEQVSRLVERYVWRAGYSPAQDGLSLEYGMDYSRLEREGISYEPGVSFNTDGLDISISWSGGEPQFQLAYQRGILNYAKSRAVNGRWAGTVALEDFSGYFPVWASGSVELRARMYEPELTNALKIPIPEGLELSVSYEGSGGQGYLSISPAEGVGSFMSESSGALGSDGCYYTAFALYALPPGEGADVRELCAPALWRMPRSETGDADVYAAGRVLELPEARGGFSLAAGCGNELLFAYGEDSLELCVYSLPGLEKTQSLTLLPEGSGANGGGLRFERKGGSLLLCGWYEAALLAYSGGRYQRAGAVMLDSMPVDPELELAEERGYAHRSEFDFAVDGERAVLLECARLQGWRESPDGREIPEQGFERLYVFDGGVLAYCGWLEPSFHSGGSADMSVSTEFTVKLD